MLLKDLTVDLFRNKVAETNCFSNITVGLDAKQVILTISFWVTCKTNSTGNIRFGCVVRIIGFTLVPNILLLKHFLNEKSYS